MEELEKSKNDSNGYFTILREINHSNSKESLCVYDENKNIVSTDQQKAALIAKHF